MREQGDLRRQRARGREVEATQEACLAPEAMGTVTGGPSAVRVGAALWEERSPPQFASVGFRVVKGPLNQPKPESRRNVALENGSPHSPLWGEDIGN